MLACVHDGESGKPVVQLHRVASVLVHHALRAQPVNQSDPAIRHLSLGNLWSNKVKLR